MGFAYSIELLVKAHRLGWPIAEVPFLWHERKAGQSRFRTLRWLPAYLRWLVLRAGDDVLEAWARHRARSRPPSFIERSWTLTRRFRFFDRFEPEHGEYDVLAEESYDANPSALCGASAAARR